MLHSTISKHGSFMAINQLFGLVLFTLGLSYSALSMAYEGGPYLTPNGNNALTVSYDKHQDYRRPIGTNFCNLSGSVGPLQGNPQDQVHDIHAQIEWGRREVDGDRAATEEGRRYANDNWQSEQARLAFEQRRECFERWRENMESIRSQIESQPYY